MLTKKNSFVNRFGKRWIVTIPRNFRGPNDSIRYYSLWTRCQYSNTSFVIPDIVSQPNIENFVCRPNKYLRYDQHDHQISEICYESRHQCSSIIGVHPYCRCQYLILTQIQQWCSIFAAICLLFAIIILYLKLIASPQNGREGKKFISSLMIVLFSASARFLLTFAPLLFLGLALILMLITMILVGVYLRRNQYEDYDIKLPDDIRRTLTKPPDTFNLYRLKGFFQNYPSKKKNDK